MRLKVEKEGLIRKEELFDLVKDICRKYSGDIQSKNLREIIEVLDEHDNTPLHCVMGNNLLFNVENIALFLNNGANPNAINKDVQIPLMYYITAISQIKDINDEFIERQSEVIEKLLSFGADLNIVDRYGNTVLGLAILYNMPKLVDLLIKKGAKLQEKKSMVPAITQAVSAKKLNPAIIKILMESKRCDINATDKYGRTALHTSVFIQECDEDELVSISELCRSEKEAEVAQLHKTKTLLELGCDPNIADEDGMTPLMNAATKEQIDLLLEHKADFRHVCLTEQGNFTAVELVAIKVAMRESYHCIDFKELYIAHRQPWLELAKRDLKSSDVQNKYYYGETFRRNALHLAIEIQDCAMVKDCIDSKIDVNAKDVKGDAPLHLAVKSQNITIIRLLLEAKADINVEDCDQNTPLLLACAHRNFTIVRDLILAGAKRNVKNKQGQNILYLIARFPDRSVISFIHLAFKDKEDRPDINAQDEHGFTPLDIVARWGANADVMFDVVKTLFDYYARIGSCKSNILEAFIREENIPLVRLALEKDADPNRRCDIYSSYTNGDSCTLLHKVVERFCSDPKNPIHFEIVDLLLQYKADSRIVNGKGETPLHKLLCTFTKREYVWTPTVYPTIDQLTREPILSMIDKLVQHRLVDEKEVSVLEKRDSFGRTPLLHAVYLRCPIELVAHLLKLGCNPDATCNEGRTALHYAMGPRPDERLDPIDFSPLVKLLLSHDTSKNYDRINAKDKQGITPLMLAVGLCPKSEDDDFDPKPKMYGQSILIKRLFSAGARVTTRDAAGKSAYDHASESTIEQSFKKGFMLSPKHSTVMRLIDPKQNDARNKSLAETLAQFGFSNTASPISLISEYAEDTLISMDENEEKQALSKRHDS